MFYKCGFVFMSSYQFFYLVLKMLAVMSENGNGERDPVQDFLTTGRAGRRNALPNILSDHAMTTTADLPDRLMGLTTKGDKIYSFQLLTHFYFIYFVFQGQKIVLVIIIYFL